MLTAADHIALAEQYAREALGHPECSPRLIPSTGHTAGYAALATAHATIALALKAGDRHERPRP